VTGKIDVWRNWDCAQRQRTAEPRDVPYFQQSHGWAGRAIWLF